MGLNRYKETEPYIEVRFNEPTEISGVVTQGHAKLQFWVTKYRVSYSPDGREPFIYYSDSPNDEIKVGFLNRTPTQINSVLMFSFDSFKS